MKDKIFVTFTSTDDVPLGTIWMIQAAKTDFYLKAVGGPPLFHLSAHGPNAFYAGHRFHVRVDDGAVDSRVRRGQFVAHGVPADGQVVRGTKVAPGAYLVVRVRWTSDLQQPSYRTAARRRGDLPSLEYHGRAGRKLSWSLRQDQAADLDLVVSYDQPYWPDADRSQRDNSRLGPLRNEAGMWLTATAYRRSQTLTPSPPHLLPRLPMPGEDPVLLLCGGIGPRGEGDLYWFADAITSSQTLAAWPRVGESAENHYR